MGELEGQRRRLTAERVALGDRPLLIVDRPDVWLVETGVMLLFTVELRDGEARGRRRFLAGFTAGEAAFTPPPDAGAGAVLLAVGDADTIVRRLDRGELVAGTATGIDAARLAVLLETWVAKVTAGSVRQLRDVGLLEHAAATPGATPAGGASVAIEAGGALRADDEVAWISGGDGRQSWLGLTSLVAPGPLALAPGAWLTCESAAVLAVADTGDALESGGAWRGVDNLGHLVVAAAREAREADGQAAQRRMRAARERDVLAERDAVDRLARVLPAEHRRVPTPVDDDPLLAATRAVAAHDGIAISQPLVAAGDGRLRAIAKASRVRVRRVRLDAEWWRSDGGPLLGSATQDGRPLALLPAGARRYDLVDPSRGERRRVDRAAAQDVSQTAHVMYRPLPAGRLSPREVLAFGLRGTRADAGRALGFGVGAGLIALGTPAATAILFESIIPAAARDRLLVLTVAFVLAAAAAAAFQVVQGIALVRIESRLSSSVQAALWDRLLRLPPTFFRRFSTGDLLQRALAVDAIQQILATVGFAGLLQIMFLALSAALLFVYDALLAVVAAGLAIVGAGVLIALLWRQLRLMTELQEARGEVSRVVLQLLNGLSKLRAAAAEERAFDQWARGFAPQESVVLRSARIQSMITTFNVAWPAVTTLVLLAVVGARRLGTTDPGMLIAFLAAFTQVLAATQLIATSAGSLLQVVPLFNRARPIFEEPPEVDASKADPGTLTGELELNDVVFRYAADGPVVLRGISLTVQPGEFVAFVGPSGAGKSSTLRLILGFEKPEAGSVAVDGSDLAGLDIEAVRRQIGVVLQNAALLPGTVFSNIVGETDLTSDDAWHAAALAGLDEDIRAMPMGMETIVTEGGTFSGGQRQRLLIARALAARPRLLLFDEATSALDNLTQRIVAESLERLGLTRIVIAHRLSTIRAADRILVFDRGEIVQEGSYDELMAADGPFRTLAERQLA